MKRDYDSSVARIAGNIASGMIRRSYYLLNTGAPVIKSIAKDSVELARAIVAETKNTEPPQER